MRRYCGQVRKVTYVLGVGSPIRHRPTSSLPRTIISNTRVWCFWSTHPPFSISARRARVALSPISSGATPASEMASAQCIPDVVDSVRSVKAYPGDLHFVAWLLEFPKSRRVEKTLTFRSRHLYTHLNKDKYQGYIGSILIVMLQSCDLRIGGLLEQRGCMMCLSKRNSSGWEGLTRSRVFFLSFQGPQN